MKNRTRILLGAVVGVLVFAAFAWAGDDSGGWLGNLIGGAMTGGVGSIFGGITGLFGNWLNARAEEKKQERSFAHEQAMATLDQQGMKLEADLQIKRETIVAEGKIDAAVASSRADGIKAADVKGDGVFNLVDRMLAGGWVARLFGAVAAFQVTQAYFIVKIIRPAAFCFFGWLFYDQWQIVGDMAVDAEMSPQAAFDYQIFMASYLLSMAASFYYCERNRVKPPEGAPSTGAGGNGPVYQERRPKAPPLPPDVDVHAAPPERDASDTP